MTPQDFLEKFEYIAEAPGGVMHLRQLALRLAVSGRLLSIHGEESADSLLIQAKNERDRRVQSGEIRAGKPLPPIRDDELPFQLPKSWSWTRVGRAFHLINGRAFKPAEWTTVGAPIIRIQNLNDATAPYNHCDKPISEKFHVSDEDLLISWSGTPGTSFGGFVWRRGKALLNQHIFRAEIFGDAFVNDFARLAINARLDEMIAQAHGGVGLRHITKGKLEMLCLPLAPKPDQIETVKQYQELMRLCDELEDRQQRRRAVRVKANDAALRALTSATMPDELVYAFHRLVNNFDDLLATPESVLGLKQAVIDCAVQAKLTRQLPSDGCGDEILKSIATQRNELLSKGSVRRLKPTRTVRSTEESALLPKTWCQCTLGDSILDLRYGTSRKCSYRRTGIGVLRIPNLKAGCIDVSDLKFAVLSTSEVNDLCLRASDLLMIRSNGSKTLVGRSAVVGEQGRKLAYAGYLVRIRTNPDMVVPRYLQLVLDSTDLRKQIETPIRTTSGVKNINSTEICNLRIALPPSAEQVRIVEQVDELMRVCNRLEAKLVSLQEKKAMFTAAAVHQILTANAIEAADSCEQNLSSKELYQQRTSVGAYIVQALHKQPTFGRVQLAKLLYLTQSHVGVDLGLDFSRQQAGPYTDRVKAIEKRAAKRNWFNTEDRPRSARNPARKGYRYCPGTKVNDGTRAAADILGDRAAELDRLLEIFRGFDTEEAELVVTTFAAWNDFLLASHTPTDDEIIHEVRENWHESKQRFTKVRIRKCLTWLRRERLVPAGNGHSTHAKDAELVVR